MKFIISGLWILLGICLPVLHAQSYVSSDPAYKENVLLADSARTAGAYQLCVECYNKAFAITEKSSLSLFRSAQCYAQLKDFKNAYRQLYKAIEDNWEYFCPLCETETLLQPLWADHDWEEILAKCAEKKAAYEATLNLPLRDELDSMLIEDQRYRGSAEMDSIETHFGWDSPQMKALWAKQAAIDSSNTLRVEEILAEYGYPGVSLVGRSSSRVVFLVIQHAELPVQEKYLPVLTQAADSGELAWSALALLIDRVNMRQGKPQVYGSQIRRDPETGAYSVYEIEDPAHVNQRRAKIGLPPLEDYVSRWGIQWGDKK